MATTTPNFSWPVPTSTDLVKDGATAIESLGDAIDASLLDLKGGTTGQVLAKASATDLDYTWTTPQVGDITGVTAGTGISGGGTSGTVTVSINTAVTADLTTAQTLTNKTLTAPVISSPKISSTYSAKTAAYTVASGDEGNIFSMNNAATQQFNIPTDATFNFAVGTEINVFWITGAGQPTIGAVTPGTTTVISTGATSATPKLRVANSGATCKKLAANSWITVRRIQAKDDAEEIKNRIAEALNQSDAILLTGGVSMGDTDHVPGAIQATLSEIVFHKLPIRPGKPILGAVGPRGQLIMGLPGNPVSVAVTFRRFAYPLLCHVSGQSGLKFSFSAQVQSSDEKTLDLVWFRLVTFKEPGIAEILSNQGSGDLAALGRSHGFVEIPSGATSNGSFQFYDWKGLTL